MNDIGPEVPRFRLHKQLFAQGSDYTIQDATGKAAYRVGARQFRLRSSFEISDCEGQVMAVIQQKLMSLHKHFVIQSEGFSATLRRENHVQQQASFLISLADSTSLLGQGDFQQHEYRILRGTTTVAQVSAGWFAGDTTYGVAVAPAEPQALLLAVAIVIDDATASPSELWASAQPLG